VLVVQRSMDKTDMALCLLLLSNSRLSYRELADKLNLSATAVHSRIRSLVEQGVIRRFSAKISIGALGAATVIIFGPSKVASAQVLYEELIKHGSVYWLGIGGGSFIYIGAYLRSIVDLEPLVGYVEKATGILEPNVGIMSYASPTGAYPSANARLSNLDYQIIRSLKDDSRKAVSDIAQELGVSSKTVRRRLNRMVELGLVDLSIDWYPDASNDIITVLHLNLKPEVDRSVVDRVLQKYWPNIFFYWGFSNIPNLLLAFMWTNTMKEVKTICENLERETVFRSVLPNVLYTGYIFKTWVDRLVDG
jgi:DNA-binding Lrp family transcriptional regulator